jgi:hypothetical protein
VKGQMALFGEVKVKVEKPPSPTTVRIGKREARAPLYKKRREEGDDADGRTVSLLAY